MPSGKTHVIAAIAATTAVVYVAELPIEYALVGAVGALLPDADHRRTPIGQYIPLWLICKHRGFTHSLIGMSAFTLLVFALFGSVAGALCFFTGYLSHLVLDWTTIRGIPLKWPRKKRYSLRRWK